MPPGDADSGFLPQVINPFDAWEKATEAGLTELFDESMDLHVLHQMLNLGAEKAGGDRYGDVRFRLRSPRTGELIVWVAVLKKREEPEIEHENLYEVIGFYEVDLDAAELL